MGKQNQRIFGFLKYSCPLPGKRRNAEIESDEAHCSHFFGFQVKMNLNLFHFYLEQVIILLYKKNIFVTYIYHIQFTVQNSFHPAITAHKTKFVFS